jgi:hypothetical protein
LLYPLPPEEEDEDEDDDEDLSTAQNIDETRPPIRLHNVGSESPAVDGPLPTPAPVSLVLPLDEEEEFIPPDDESFKFSTSLTPSFSLNVTGTV